jgi:hypothetical protein
VRDFLPPIERQPNSGQSLPSSGHVGLQLALGRSADAITTGELRPLDLDALSMTLYCAIRSAGEYVVKSADQQASVVAATTAITALIEGLRDR